MEKFEIPFGDLPTIRVNKILMDTIVGREMVSILTADYREFKVGEKIRIVAVDFNTGEETGMWCTRYVYSVYKDNTHITDEEYQTLWLVPWWNKDIDCQQAKKLHRNFK